MNLTPKLVCNAVANFFFVAAVVGAFIVVVNLPASSVEEFKHEVIVIEGCEYIKFPSYQYQSITHKGNCKNHE